MSAETGISTGPNVGEPTPTNLIEVVATWMDPEGEVSITKTYWVETGELNVDNLTLNTLGTLVGNIVSVMQPLSNSQLVEVFFGTRIAYSFLKPPEPGSGSDDIEDKAFIQYTTNLGGLVKMNLPTPVAEIFMADGETVDPTDGLLLAYSTLAIPGSTISQGAVTAASAVLKQCDVHGNPIAAYVKGFKRRAKTRRRLRQGISTEIGG